MKRHVSFMPARGPRGGGDGSGGAAGGRRRGNGRRRGHGQAAVDVACALTPSPFLWGSVFFGEVCRHAQMDGGFSGYTRGNLEELQVALVKSEPKFDVVIGVTPIKR